MDTKELRELAPCPCGKTPAGLVVQGDGGSEKWAQVSGNCCGEWSIEFRNQYAPIPGDESMSLAVSAWNDATRSQPEKAEAELAALRARIAEAPVVEIVAHDEGGDDVPIIFAPDGHMVGQRVRLLPAEGEKGGR